MKNLVYLLSNMSNEKLSSLINILVAVSVLVAGFFQWWDITYDGAMITRPWVKTLFAALIILLLLSAKLLIKK